MKSSLDFEHEFRTRFWPRYPRKERPVAALKAYALARGKASCEEILAGVERYLEHLPSEARYIWAPTTFLNDECWRNEYVDTLPAKPEPQVGKLTAALQRASAGFVQGTMRRVK